VGENEISAATNHPESFRLFYFDTGLYLVLLILCLSAIWYYFMRFMRRLSFSSDAGRSRFPPTDYYLEADLRSGSIPTKTFASFCQQDYPEYQIIFGVRDERDLCVEVVKKIIDDFPEIDIRLVVSDRTIGTNLVSNLANASRS